MNFWQNVNIQDRRFSPSYKKLRMKESGRVTFTLKMFMTTSTKLIYLIQENNTQETIDVRDVASIC